MVNDISHTPRFLKELRMLNATEQASKKEKHIESVVRKNLIDVCLGQPGDSPSRPTIIFYAITSNIYLDYLCSKRKWGGHHETGAILRPTVYGGLRSSLTYLFKRYGRKMDPDIYETISEGLKGVTRIANRARQKGEGNIEDGKRELSFPVYCKLNHWFAEDGTAEGIFARAFSTVSWNLACRGDSTSQVLAKHLILQVDSTGIPFSNSKAEQTGSDRRKRQPRHCYPLEWRADMMSSVFDYLACFPEVLNDPEGRLF
jgi:hypothetical protein